MVDVEGWKNYSILIEDNFDPGVEYKDNPKGRFFNPFNLAYGGNN